MSEKDLLVAVVQRAYEDCLGNLSGIPGTTSNEKKKQLIMSARRWIFSDKIEIMSFLWICDILKLPEEKIRDRVKKEIANRGLEA